MATNDVENTTIIQVGLLNHPILMSPLENFLNESLVANAHQWNSLITDGVSIFPTLGVCLQRAIIGNLFDIILAVSVN